jgi:hypothetical protein
MTIKHLGGIFGRNPTFNDVTITDITVDDITVNSGGSIRLNGTSDDFLTFQQGGTQAVIQADSATSANLVLRVKFGGSSKDSLKLLSNGNVQVPSGNVEFTASGDGIEFADGPFWSVGSGTPEGSVTASVGSLYTRTDGGASTTLYVKESGTGNTGWVAK